jgi:hypothetical protein
VPTILTILRRVIDARAWRNMTLLRKSADALPAAREVFASVDTGELRRLAVGRHQSTH